jgi:periplasmic divalent cation tolerance protein
MTDKIIVLITCSAASEARKVAQSLVKRRLAGCVNILHMPVESIYRWKGRVESAKEVLLIVKSSRRRLAGLQSEVRRLHGYEVPEIVALPIVAGSQEYLRWLSESLGASKTRRKS